MARPSSSGLPFLVRRNESGAWTYHRAFPAEIVPFIEGEVVLGWSGKAMGVERVRAFKTSLGTTDPATARDRWALVHAEVQRIVERAGQRLADAREAQRRPLTRRTSLTPDERQVIADQVRHDILAQHDLETVEPEALSPIAAIVTGLMAGSNRPREEIIEFAQRQARRIELDQAKRALRKGGTAVADTELVVREVRATEGAEALAEAIAVVPPEIDRRLSENGVALLDDREQRLAQLALRRARLEAHQTIAKREAGANIPTPGRPQLIVPTPASDSDEDPAPTISAMLETWRKHTNPKDKEWADRALYANRFILAYGDLKVTEVKKKHVREFRDLHHEVPKAVPHRLRGASLAELIAYGKQNPSVPCLAWHTINTKALGSLQAILSLAVKEGYCETNVASGLQLDTERDPRKTSRLPFGPEQVLRLFAAPEFTSGKPLSAGGCGEAGYWLPILSFYTGARVEELAQLEVADIKSAYGHLYLDITTMENAPDRDGDPIAHQKSLKNQNARREVPLHPDLITLGFPAYVDEMKRGGHRRVFPKLQAYRGRFSKNIGRWLNRLLDTHVSKRSEYAYHSVRHVFADDLRNKAPLAGVFDKVINGLIGHAGGETSDKYGLPHALKTRQVAVNLFSIEGLDLSKFKRPGSQP